MLPLNRSRSRSRFFPVGVPSAPTDPFWSDVSLLLNTTSTNGAQNNTFLDSSANAFSVTRNGNTTQGNFSPFSQTGWSNFFDGTGDYLSVADNAALELGSSNFTAECYVYLTGYAANNGGTFRGALFYKSVSGSRSYEFFLNGTASSWTDISFDGYDSGGAFTSITGAFTFNLNTWYHVACVRNGNNILLFVNGTQVNSTTAFSRTINNATSALKIGGAVFDATFLFYLPGYISNARLVVGTAVYTSNFTPPTTPLTAITNTSLLTCQSNRFIDNSSNAFAITRNGDVSVQAFSPFAPAAAWSASTNGGSGYFDGTGDYLTVPDNAAFTLGSGNFTVEAWIFNGTTGARKMICGQGDAGGFQSSISVAMEKSAANKLSAGICSGSTAYTAVSTADLPLNQWVHVAFVRNGNTGTLYINGTADGTVSLTGVTANDSTNLFAVGAVGQLTTLTFEGYISNFRQVVGTAVYTANFTPPTAPLTAISGTSLLLNFTNAGIYDSAAKNDLETVGNAQVSTTQAKWGTTSMAFDGTGDWLTVIDKPVLRFGTGAFTIEGWLYLGATGAARGIVGKGTSTTGWLLSTDASDKVVFTYGTSTIVSTGALSGSTWYYIAVVREGTGANQTKIYINGTNDGTGTVSTDFNQTSIMYVGANRTGGDALNGYIDDLRITNGVARYTGNFTPPTAAFPLN